MDPLKNLLRGNPFSELQEFMRAVVESTALIPELVDAMAAGDAPSVLAVIGTDDAWTPPEHVEELEATGATVLRYVGADHGFVHDASRPAHRADDAADAWRRVVDWLGV